MISLVWTASKTHTKPFDVGTKLHVHGRTAATRRCATWDDASQASRQPTRCAPKMTRTRLGSHHMQRALSREGFEVSGSVLRLCLNSSSSLGAQQGGHINVRCIRQPVQPSSNDAAISLLLCLPRQVSKTRNLENLNKTADSRDNHERLNRRLNEKDRLIPKLNKLGRQRRRGRWTTTRDKQQQQRQKGREKHNATETDETCQLPSEDSMTQT